MIAPMAEHPTYPVPLALLTDGASPNRSISEWIASLRIPTDPVSRPAATLIVIRNEFDAIETVAARVLAGGELDMVQSRGRRAAEQSDIRQAQAPASFRSCSNVSSSSRSPQARTHALQVFSQIAQ